MTTPITPLPEVAPMGESGPDAPPQPAAKRRGRPPGSKDKTPRKTATTAPDKAPRTTSRTSSASLEKRIGSSLTTVGVGVMMLSPKDGEVIINGVPALAKSLGNLAQQNPAVKANLERALTAGAWSGVLAAVLPIGIGIAANHGMVPESVAKMLSTANADESDVAPAA
jgi:hypothetical protein